MSPATVQAMTTSKTESLHDIERELWVLLRRVRRQSAANARSIHPELQPTAYAILLHVLEHDTARAAHVVDQLGIDKGAVSRNVTHLVELGFLERANDPLDGRAQTLVASDLGRQLVADLRRRRRSDIAGRLESWTEEELGQFVEQLGRYNASLEA
jgi:DNA-binding MarR family transcriptional regulator